MLPQPPSRQPSGDNAFQAIWRNPYIRAATFLLLLYLAYLVLGSVSHIVVLAVIAYIIAYLAHPMLVWLEKRKINRAIGVLLTVVLIFGLIVLASGLLVTIFNQLSDLIQRLPALTKEFLTQPWFNNLADRFPPLSSVRDQITKISQNGAAGLQQYIQPYIDTVLPYLKANSGALFGGVLSVASIVGEAFAVLIMSIYMMLDYDKLGLNFLRLFPRTWQPFVLDLSKNVGQAVGGYLKGQLIIAAFVGIFIGVALSIAGVPSAPAIGFIAGVFNVVPYLGVVIGITPALLLAASAGGVVKLIVVVVVFVVANQIEGHLLSPMVLGRTTNLHPVTVIIAILTGLTLMGITGALLAVPLAALGKLLLQEYYYPSRVYKDGP
ncbi:AI-2E family transporter [Deinococcus detaillensis]|uniref:AI-2E family transporter n=1 Tax=Deinococcus detaillensis TaxID=2592048 RepID=A0A553UU07_9DEIO|nr:AI-2E family transporter [Deinococcus detaillensis]TSA83692.1 AI-2E family transporter [Deinococcus detaillensis]